MSSIEKGFMPLRKAQSEQVRFQVSLPEFIDQGGIGVNLREIHRLCQIGGIRRLVVFGVEDVDTSKATPQILGFNSQGSAYMGKAGSNTIIPPTESYSAINPESFWRHTQSWRDAVIVVNMDEVSKRITSDEKWAEGIRDLKAWSHYLNKGIKDGISKEGVSHLLKLPDKVSLAIFGVAVTTNTAGLWRLEPQSTQFLELLTNYFLMGAGWNTLDRVFGRKPKLSDQNTRYTLFWGPEVDRAILLKILTKTSTLVKQIPRQVG